MGKSLYPPGAIFCRHCGYCLHALTVNRCPECGHEFDPDDSKTFRTRPLRVWPKRLLLWAGIPLLILAVAYGSFVGWLYMGWRSEANARELHAGELCEVKTRPILSPALAQLLPTGWRIWQERVDSVMIAEHALTREQIQAIAACRQLHTLALLDAPLTAEDLASLCQCRELSDLELVGAKLRSADLAPLANLSHLTVLRLDGSAIDDAALPVLCRLTGLKLLGLSGSAITDQGVPRLSALANLEDLELNGCLTDSAVPQLSRLTGLKRLSLKESRFTEAAIATLRAALPGCTVYFSPRLFGAH